MTVQPKGRTESAPLHLNQEKLQAQLRSFLGRTIEFPTAPARASIPSQPKQMPSSLAHTLQKSFILNFNQSWSLPRITAPLSEDEINFLKTHSMQDICGSTVAQNPIMQFCIQVIQSIATQLVISAFKGKNEEAMPKKEAERGLASLQDAKDEEASKRAKSDLKHDPFVKSMKKISQDTALQRIKSAVKKEIAKITSDFGDQAAIEKGLKALDNQGSLKDAAQIVVDAQNAQKAFVKQAGKVLGTAVKTGQFLSKSEEVGPSAALGEMAASTLANFLSKQSAKILSTFVGCTNPIWCAGVFTTIIYDTFTPQETAPASHDMYGPLPPPSIEDLRRSHLPTLDPPYPTLQRQKEGIVPP